MRKFSKKTIVLMVSIALLLCIGVGNTLAYLIDVTGEVKNTFIASQVSTSVVESFDGNVKSDVRIQNTSDIEANIRAAIVVSWQNADGDVYGTAPVAGTDYELVLDLANGWSKKADGFYYWANPVAADDHDPTTTDDMTGVLIVSCTAKSTAPEGYALCVEILGSGIQAEGIPAGSHPWFN